MRFSALSDLGKEAPDGPHKIVGLYGRLQRDVGIQEEPAASQQRHDGSGAFYASDHDQPGILQCVAGQVCGAQSRCQPMLDLIVAIDQKSPDEHPVQIGHCATPARRFAGSAQPIETPYACGLTMTEMG